MVYLLTFDIICLNLNIFSAPATQASYSYSEEQEFQPLESQSQSPDDESQSLLGKKNNFSVMVLFRSIVKFLIS